MTTTYTVPNSIFPPIIIPLPSLPFSRTKLPTSSPCFPFRGGEGRSAFLSGRVVYFLLKEQPSVRRALPPVGWQSTVVQPWQMTTVCACEKTVVMVKQPGHLTSMKKERGAGTRVCTGQRLAYCVVDCPEGVRGGCRVGVRRGRLRGRRTLSLCLRASEAGAGLRRSTARTCHQLANTSNMQAPSPIRHHDPPSLAST